MDEPRKAPTDAVERVLDYLDYQGEAVTTPCAARIVLFSATSLAQRASGIPLSRAAEGACVDDGVRAAVKLCEVEGKDWQDRQLITDVVRRVGCALRKLRAARAVECEQTQAGQVWRVRPAN